MYRPPFFSIHAAFFLGSTHREPAMSETIVDGGTRRRPGPSLSGIAGLEGYGRSSGGTISPGRIIPGAAIWPEKQLLDHQEIPRRE